MKKPTDVALTISADYRQFIEQLKARVVAARTTAARAVNIDLISLYWDIGRGIVEKQKTLGWGDSVVEMVSGDLRRAFPRMTGFSARNLWDMRRLYEVYMSPDLLSQAVTEINQDRARPILRQPVAELAQDEKRTQWAALIQIKPILSSNDPKKPD